MFEIVIDRQLVRCGTNILCTNIQKKIYVNTPDRIGNICDFSKNKQKMPQVSRAQEYLFDRLQL